MPFMFTNPYYGMNALRDPEMFFGRSYTLRRIYSAIASRQCISLVGSLHLGKSSVLHALCMPELQRRFEWNLNHHILVLIDLRAYLRKSAEDFFKEVSKQMVVQSRGRLELALSEGSGEDVFSNMLDQINDQGCYPVLLMDAFDNVTRNQRFDPEFFSFLRSQAGRVSYVTASTFPLYEVRHRAIENSPFFNIFDTCFLEALTTEEARDLVEQPARNAGLPFSEDETVWLLRLAGRHPFFIQRACYFLLDEKSQQAEVDRQQVRNRISEALHPHFASTWEGLNQKQRQLLEQEARRAEASNRSLPELSESGLFRRFVLDACQVQLFAMTVENVEVALDHLDDLQFLGECDLKYMRQLPHTRNGDMLKANERGKTVRDALNRAFEQLRGDGLRRDSEADWRIYNILYYRYFKYHLKNEQISARLGFSSLRQYFRERNKAIASLYQNLLEMEATSVVGDED